MIVNSDFYLDNEDVLKDKLVECYDTDPVIYYKNKIKLKNNSIMKEYAKRLKENIQNYLDTKKDPVYYHKDIHLVTCIDQEMIFTTYLEMKDKIKFFPLNNIYNDTQYTKEGIIWHAKGVHRTYPEYLIECWKYKREDVNIFKEYLRLYYRKFKRFIKSFLIEPPENFKIKELEDIINSLEIKSIMIVNSDFYLDNEDVLKDKLVECYDTDPVIYYKNKIKLKNKNVLHKYIIYDTQLIKKKDVDLLICEEKNLKVTTLLNDETKIIKSK